MGHQIIKRGLFGVKRDMMKFILLLTVTVCYVALTYGQLVQPPVVGPTIVPTGPGIVPPGPATTFIPPAIVGPGPVAPVLPQVGNGFGPGFLLKLLVPAVLCYAGAKKGFEDCRACNDTGNTAALCLTSNGCFLKTVTGVGNVCHCTETFASRS